MPKPRRHSAKHIKTRAVVLDADAPSLKAKIATDTGDEDGEDDNSARDYFGEIVAGLKTTVQRIRTTLRRPDPPRYSPSEVWPDPPRRGTGTLGFGEQDDTSISSAVAGADTSFQLGHAEFHEPIPRPRRPLPKAKGVVVVGAKPGAGMALDRKTQLQLRLQVRFATLDSIGITCQEVPGEAGTALKVYLILPPLGGQHNAWAEQQILQTNIEASDYEQRSDAELVEQMYQALLPGVQAYYPEWRPEINL
jgi:hypothetical protein